MGAKAQETEGKPIEKRSKKGARKRALVKSLTVSQSKRNAEEVFS